MRMSDASLTAAPAAAAAVAVAGTKRAAPNRSGSQYARKRASQACLTCRARKSRCDNQRPRCSFCISAGADCNWPGSDLNKLDSASLLILDRLERVEENILSQLQSGGDSHQQSPAAAAAAVAASPAKRRGRIWMNGDRVMTWHSSLALLGAPTPSSETWCAFRRSADEALVSNTGAMASLLSPTIMLEGAEMRYAGKPQPFLRALMTPVDSIATAETLARRYIELVHSRYPILDVTHLRQIMDKFSDASDNGRPAQTDQLLQVLDTADMAIFFLVLALGQVTAYTEPLSEQAPPSPYLDKALALMGLAVFGECSPIKSLQIQLLLASYHMWTLRPLKAWSVVDSAALAAEKAMSRYPEMKESLTGHRVLWTTSKMHLEIMEELQVHCPSQRLSSLKSFMKASTLPHPSTDPFAWSGVDPALGSKTWYYYLAETSSRRLIERIKDEMYGESVIDAGLADLASGTKKFGEICKDTVGHLVSLYSVASELHRQIDEWSNSLPENFRITLQQAQATDTSLANTHPQGLTKYLWNRECQLRLITFRPFIALLSELPTTEGIHEYQIHVLLDGAKIYLKHALQFIHSQDKKPERHYGTWLFGRNMWTVALTILSACNTQILWERMEPGPNTPGMQMSPSSGLADNSESPMSEGRAPICSYPDAISAVEKALEIIGHWVQESSSLHACAELLSILLRRTRELRG
ncbi:hypothetical protein B0I35DRAFT_445849 [Stachybotrys elegans]|uniref:Zn(2)-C6 fungal-type domain-containing protein n=1 Tax=Stachybotrys elegans TaxID=80388 RepID=A0A8K0SH51_9HYPO|nr:hypothetical protein B0I35DRAFT_445849 [Stachybotrys elegans]